MKYLIIGAGGTGGPLGFYLTKAGKDVTLIARGAHLKALSEQGLTNGRLWNGTRETILVKAVDMEHYDEQPDVILVCVKGYSLDDTVPFIRKVMKKNTIVIPILNIYGTGGKLQKQLPEILVTDGCIYVAAAIKEPGVLEQYGKVLSLVFGVRDSQKPVRNWKRSGQIWNPAVSEHFFPIISREQHWRNSPMCHRSVRLAYIITQRQQIL